MVKSEVLKFFSVPSGNLSVERKRLLRLLRGFAKGPAVWTPCNGELLQSLLSGFAANIPVPVNQYLEFLGNSVIQHATNVASPRCMGHMTSIVPEFFPVLADILLALNQNMVKRDASRTLTLLERQTLSLLHRHVYSRPQDYYDQHSFNETSTLGIMQSGGTSANLTALWIARNACFASQDGFGGIEKEGISAALDHYRVHKAVVLAPALAHYSIQKAASLLGLGEHAVVTVPVDANGRVSVGSLRDSVLACRERNWRVIAIVAVAGTTDCGSIDPLSEVGAVAEEFKVHFHIDAAWGMPLVLSRQHRHLLSGIGLADSVTMDGHKQFYLPVGTSVLLLRNPGVARAIEKQARYMLREDSGDLGKRSLEGSRPGVALFLHAALSIIGLEGYALLLDENIARAKVMADKLERHERFQLLMRPETNIVVYRYIPTKFVVASRKGTLSAEDNREINNINILIQEAQADRGHAYVSRTTLDFITWLKGPVVALRAVMSNPFTNDSDIDFVLQDQMQVAAALDLGRVSPASLLASPGPGVTS